MSRGIPQRKRIYLGCEGTSEQSYGKRLNELADSSGLHLALDCDVLQPGGGDPLAIVQLAVKRIQMKIRKRGGFERCAVLLDRDTLSQNPDWEAQISALERKNKIFLIWQRPCHEGFLLRHLADQTTRTPQSSELAIQALKRVWPDYRKGMPATDLAARIDRSAIERAASVEPNLNAFLKGIGFIREQQA